MLHNLSLSTRGSRILQLTAAGLFILWLTRTLFFYQSDVTPALITPPETLSNRPRHPIDDLRQQAQKDFESLIDKRTDTVYAAEKAYLERRGRRPPPGFDKWFAFAQDHDGIIVEDFFDRLYDELKPFWAVPPIDIRRRGHDWKFTISIRNANVTKKTDIQRPWLDLWADLISNISHLLPDIDLAINEMDESRVVVPWEEINGYIQEEAKTRKVVDVANMTTKYSNLVIKEGEHVPEFDYAFTGDGSYWDMCVRGCHPHSPARDGFVPTTDFSHPQLPRGKPPRSYEGYVKNWTLTKSPCEHPTLQGLHGTFVEPLSISTTHKMIPMFGGSKLPMNNEILLPPAMYWTDDPFYSGGLGSGGDWKKKLNKIVWRGDASGGRNRAENWHSFQRHRLIAMMNGTNVAMAEEGETPPPNMVLPEPDAYNLSFDRKHPMSSWLSKITDVGFVRLLCFPDNRPPFCDYTDPWFEVVDRKDMQQQYNYKYLPDLDGNSFSGRYRGFLKSSSLPIKATIYEEWHDSRLMPWVHFVPMHNTFIDFYGILEYFIGTETKAGHDDVAKKIALEGQSWAAKTLRKEDMLIYVLRTLLEYARICDDNRENLGWASGSA